MKAAPELVGAEDWWEQITPTPKVAAAEGWWDSLITTENNDTEAVNVDELASTSHGTGGAATSLEASQSETSRRQLKRQAARERKRVTKKAKLDNEEGTTSQQPLGDDQPSSPSSTVEAPTVPGEDPDVSAQQISPSSPPPSKSMRQLKRETKKERPQDLAKVSRETEISKRELVRESRKERFKELREIQSGFAGKETTEQPLSGIWDAVPPLLELGASPEASTQNHPAEEGESAPPRSEGTPSSQEILRRNSITTGFMNRCLIR